MSLQSRWNRATEWALAHFTRPPVGGRRASIAIIAGMILVIGVIDSLLGIHISLFIVYLVPLSLAVTWLGWRSAIACALAATAARLAGDLVSIDFHPLPFYVWWNTSSGLITFLIVIWILQALITLHRQLERRIEERTRALQEAARARQSLQHELLDISTRERNAVGRELHDELGQHLVGTALAAQVLAQQLESRTDPAAQDARAIVNWVEDGVAKTRLLARGLLLATIEPEDLDNELHELAAASTRGGVRCRFRQDGSPWLADATAAVQLLRIAQEATRNALRHSQARHIDITLTGDRRSTCLMVEDDGRGLPPTGERGEGMGLRIMEHRASLAGGTLSVLASPGEGTRVICRLAHGAA